MHVMHGYKGKACKTPIVLVHGKLDLFAIKSKLHNLYQKIVHAARHSWCEVCSGHGQLRVSTSMLRLAQVKVTTHNVTCVVYEH